MKKHIIISNYDDISNPYYAGGGARAVHEAAVQLARTFRVTVLTGHYPGAKNRTIAGVSYRRIGIAFGGPKLGQLVYQLVLPYYVLSGKYAVWLESFTPPFSTGLLQLFTRKPVIGLVHMLAGDDMKRKYHLPFDRFEKLGLRTYRHFIVTSESISQKIRAINPAASVVVIPNGVTVLPFSRNTEKKHILFLGRIEVNQKGLDLLLLAYQRIAAKTSYRLVIAGGGEEKQVRLLQHMIRELGLTDTVFYVGRVEGERKHRLLYEAACLVIPSRFETFSMAALEALTAGIPLVTFRIPGLSWLPTGAAMTVQAFDTALFAKALLRLEKSKRKISLPRLRQLAAQYSWNRIGKQYEAYVSAVLKA